MNENKIIDQFKRGGIDEVMILPCDRIKFLIEAVGKHFSTINLTREEVGVGIGAGIALAGRRPAILIQSTGAATLFNALISLTGYYRLPLPMIISLRGYYREKIEAQVPLGEVLPGLFAAAKIRSVMVDEPERIDLVGQAISSAFENSEPVAILLSPKIFEPSNNPPPVKSRARFDHKSACRAGIKDGADILMTRFDVIKAAAPLLKDSAVIVNIGIPCKEYYSVADGPNVFYMLGSLGLASAIGYGIARHSGRHVAVIDGDGSLLMTPQVFHHVGDHLKENLTIMAIDNQAFGSTGNQPTPTAGGRIDLEEVAIAMGVTNTAWAASPDRLKEILSMKQRPAFVHVLARPGNTAAAEIPLTGIEIRQRFQRWLKKG